MSSRPTVETPSGVVRGVVRSTGSGGSSLRYGEVAAFLGIRYGEAPVGERRFRAPVPVAPWAGVLDATEYGPRSVQPTSLLAPAGEPEDEDCLVLNVWTPDVDAALPTMVWIHGGSFTTGSGSLNFYDGSRLAARGAVVVSINYRLGALGFLHLAGLDDAFAGTSNLGLLDQRLALEWVQRHIASFGGDPQRVTIFGESAGAMSVSLQVATAADSGLFHRAIAQSGAAGHVQTADHGTAVAERVVSLLGLGPRELSAVRDVPAAAIRDAVATVSAERLADIVLPFCPTIDGTVIPDAPVGLLRSGSGAAVALLSGTNAHEMNLFRLQALLSGSSGELTDRQLRARMANMVEFWQAGVDADTAIGRYRARFPLLGNGELWSAVSTDTMFRVPMTHMLDAHAAAGAPTWSYHFTHPSHAFDGALGAAHAIEIPFVFDNVHQDGVEFLLGPITDERARFASDVADTWVRFAAADDLDTELTVPGTEAVWGRYGPRGRTQAVLDHGPELVEDLNAELLTMWIADGDPATGR
ncbi:MAG: carboxylesterase family protein [Actinobacteria bacterium]|nr:carboxylesterase family protein [Actinomycetota bacterium]